jgi:hypothetical protein
MRNLLKHQLVTNYVYLTAQLYTTSYIHHNPVILRYRKGVGWIK